MQVGLLSYVQFTGGLCCNHHLSLNFPFTKHVHNCGVAPRRLRELSLTTSVDVKIRVLVGETPAVTTLLQNGINLPMHQLLL